jgi:hypothetical protein
LDPSACKERAIVSTSVLSSLGAQPPTLETANFGELPTPQLFGPALYPENNPKPWIPRLEPDSKGIFSPIRSTKGIEDTIIVFTHVSSKHEDRDHNDHRFRNASPISKSSIASEKIGEKTLPKKRYLMILAFLSL